ncbi:formate dehydrogenase subunit delta [Methylicorpusculum sp.]|uniref:formate dehydrogenase subunit delta n=1 Tax=Methylicorpusculum sp. TaxID=2713644 RepID=UPI0027250638|nr:formate dehydrogenase subunit delta [Methylicorpusculum sp.]MDO8842934.1 formate dehydrogenase subunit delta [Methylicorpusculum sp.]
MNIERLIKMANDIGDFFNAESDKEAASVGIRNHILRSWDPRMRREIIDYCEKDGTALHGIVKTAIDDLARSS